MLQGFYRCATYDHNLDDSTCLALVVRRVDIKLHNWWHKAMWKKRITSATWPNFRKVLRECFLPSSTVVPCPKSMVTVGVIQQPPKVMHRLADVGKSITHLLIQRWPFDTTASCASITSTLKSNIIEAWKRR
jgi:hypothetical protein